MVEAYSRISFSSGWKKVIDGINRIYVAAGGKLPKVEIELPEAQRLALADRFAPLVEELEEKRREVVARVDQKARRYALVPALLVFLLFLVFGRDLGGAVVFGMVVAVGAWVVVQHKEAEAYRLLVKERFGTALMRKLSDFDYKAAAPPDMEAIRSWRLFPELRRVEMEDRMTGERNGRNVALSRLAVAYDRTGGKNAHDIVLNAVCAEVEFRSGGGGTTVVMPRKADPRLRAGPGKKHGLREETTDDPAFDGAYWVFTDAPRAVAGLLDSRTRGRILALEKGARGGLPYVVFAPGKLVVLYPVEANVPPFTPPPFYEPLDGDGMLAMFASDLAGKYRLLAAAMEVAAG
jgi:hypothetical protein